MSTRLQYYVIAYIAYYITVFDLISVIAPISASPPSFLKIIKINGALIITNVYYSCW